MPWVVGLVVLLLISVAVSVGADSKTGGGDGGDLGMGDMGDSGAVGDLGDFGDLGGIGDSAGPGDDGAGGDIGDLGDIGGDIGGDAGSVGGETGGDGSASGSGTTGSSGSGSSGSGSTSGGSDPAPPPDPTEEAFKAVSPGDCLKLWHTGSEWSSTTPIKADCDSQDGVMWVSSVKNSTGACPSGPGLSYLYYQGSSGDTTALCLTRQFKEGYCFLGKQEGSGSGAKITDANLMSLVECTASQVPSPWNQIMHITGVYAAPANVTYEHCARVQGDQTYYWHWIVNEGKTLVCTMVYGS